MTNLEYYKEILNSKFNYIGRGANEGHWRSTPKGQEEKTFIELKKIYGYKNSAAVQVTLFDEKEYGIWIKIEFYLAGYYEWTTHFEGYLETQEDIHHIFRMLGL
jgi:hypothetical protein